MSRHARVDAPGQYYHVMSRGIERREIFSRDEDYRDLLEQIEAWLKRCGGRSMAWYLMPNHFHKLGIRNERPLVARRQGYGVNFS